MEGSAHGLHLDFHSGAGHLASLEDEADLVSLDPASLVTCSMDLLEGGDEEVRWPSAVALGVISVSQLVVIASKESVPYYPHQHCLHPEGEEHRSAHQHPHGRLSPGWRSIMK